MEDWSANKCYSAEITEDKLFNARGQMYAAPKGWRGRVWVNESRTHLVCQCGPGTAIIDKALTKPVRPFLMPTNPAHPEITETTPGPTPEPTTKRSRATRRKK